MPEHPPERTSRSRPYDVLFQMIISKWITQALGTVVELGVPDQLSKGARQCSRIAWDARVSEDGLYRLLRGGWPISETWVPHISKRCGIRQRMIVGYA